METDKLIVVSEMSEEEKELVKIQLSKILKSTYFNSAKQMKRFLEYVVEKTLAGKGNLLKQYTIGVEALEFPDDFDSDNNPAVRIMGGRVRTRLNDFYKNIENNQIIIEILKGTYAPEFRFNTVNTKISNTQLKAENKGLETSSGPRIALVSFSDKTQSAISNRLVLRVTDVLARELSNFVLAKFIVYNPLSDKSESYKLHQEIDTDYKLNLYVQELPNKQYELLCRLTDFNGEVEWSESYSISADIPLGDQEDIFAKLITMVVDPQQGKLHMNWARRLLLNKATIPAKYKAAVYYRHFYDNLDIESFSQAVEACESAIERNSDDIIANIMLSDLCRRDYVHCFNIINSPVIKGVQYAERATHLRQDSHEAHFALGQIFFSQGDWDRCLDELVLARSINHCNAVVEYACGFHFCLMDRWEEGLALVKKAMGMSKNYPSWYHLIVSLSYYRKGNYKEALTEAEKIVSPGVAHGPLVRCIAYSQLGEIDKAKKELQEIAIRMPNIKTNGHSLLKRFFGNEELTKKIWEGLEIAIKA